MARFAPDRSRRIPGRENRRQDVATSTASPHVPSADGDPYGPFRESPMIAVHWDVIVVGGGPAGAAVALTQPPGRRILIVDRRRAPWRKPCDGILTPMSRR